MEKEDLVRIVGPDRVRPAAAEDSVSGVDGRLVVSPRSTGEVSAIMGLDGGPVIVRGNGTKLAWGAAPRSVEVVLDMSTMGQVVEYAPSDLIAIVQPGLPMRAFQQLLAEKGQRFALDDPTGAGTVGGTVVANASGPRRFRFGSARDLVIGVTTVLADGTVAKAGGKVVKNVAGYDLMKLMIGSLGTLAVVTELAVRLHPLPPATAVVAVEVADPDAAQRAVLHTLQAQSAPTAVELDWTGHRLYVLFEGSPGAVARRAGECADSLGGAVQPEFPPHLEHYPAGILVKSTFVPNGLSDVLSALEGFPGARIHGQAGTGVLYAGVDSSTPDALSQLRAAVAAHGGSAVVLGADDLDVWGPVGTVDLMRRVKAEFDPDNRLSPGRFVGGI